jgi:hypothetical protein
MAVACAQCEGEGRHEGARERGEQGAVRAGVLIAFYRAEREAEVARIGGGGGGKWHL